MLLDVEQFKGRQFDQEHQHCYTLVRDFYAVTYQIELSDYACPANWWHQGLDLYRDLAESEGFHLVHEHPSLWRTGDILVMAIQASVGNHLGILLPGSKILHHLHGQLSSVTQYGGLFRNNTVAVYRHPGVLSQATQIVDVRDLMPLHVRRRLENTRAD